MRRAIGVEQVEDIALGAAVLGTGGGGDPYIGKLMAIQAIQDHGPVELATVDEMADDDWSVSIAMMGAPTVIVEKVPGGQEAAHAFRAIESFLGRPIKYIYSIEAGGINSTIPITLAAQLRMPLLDLDGMGRAFPEIQMVTHNLHGITATPFTMADEKGNSAVLSTINNRWMETFARSIAVNMGATAYIAAYAASGKEQRVAAVPGTMTLAETIGRTIREARAAHVDVVERICATTRGFVIFQGKIVDVQRRTVAGFARGEAVVEGTGKDLGHKLAVQFQNENLVAARDGELIVTVPDLITIVEEDSGEPITTEALRYGFRVNVLGIPCHPHWRTDAALAVVGPRYFGYEVDYTPVETRMSR
ncbi:MAG: DUF917 domain-containing protein [Caldilineaceae bacterium]|nr:DUF917 domain-containing protein [Caldilineaceae bacterium]